MIRQINTPKELYEYCEAMEMSKLEKVIKGFTICSEHGLLNGEDCHGHYEYTDNLADIIKANDYSKQCPYNGCETGCVKTLAKDTLALLKEQEAVEPISYKNCADAMLKMWMERVLTDGEYNRIMDKLNKAHKEGKI